MVWYGSSHVRLFVTEKAYALSGLNTLSYDAYLRGFDPSVSIALIWLFAYVGNRLTTCFWRQVPEILRNDEIAPVHTVLHAVGPFGTIRRSYFYY